MFLSNNDKFKKVESKLYDYKKTKLEINVMKRNLDLLENDYINESSEDQVELNDYGNQKEKIRELKYLIRIKEIEIQNIDNAFEILSEEEQIFINERYFNHKANKYVAALLNIAEQTSCVFRNKLINKLIPILVFDYL